MKKAKCKKLRVKRYFGISIIEMLVVITVFSILGVIVTQSIVLTMRGSKKSEGLVAVRENVDYAIGIIERQLRNADSVDCDNSTATNLLYTDINGKAASFSCISGDDPYVASGSARLTSNVIKVTGCSFTCTEADTASPAHVDVSLQAESATLTGSQNSSVSTSNRIYLRNY